MRVLKKKCPINSVHVLPFCGPTKRSEVANKTLSTSGILYQVPCKSRFEFHTEVNRQPIKS